MNRENVNERTAHTMPQVVIQTYLWHNLVQRALMAKVAKPSICFGYGPVQTVAVVLCRLRMSGRRKAAGGNGRKGSRTFSDDDLVEWTVSLI